MFSRTGDRKDLALTAAESNYISGGTGYVSECVAARGQDWEASRVQISLLPSGKRKSLMLGAHIQMGGRSGI